MLTCSFFLSAARAALDFEVADVVELLKLLFEPAVCVDALLTFLLAADCFAVGGFGVGSGIEVVDAVAGVADDNGILCERVPTRIETGWGFGFWTSLVGLTGRRLSFCFGGCGKAAR